MSRLIILGALLSFGCATTPAMRESSESPANPNVAESPAPELPALSLQAPPTSPVPAKRYRCPMHPSIVSSQPGKCPICGMGLEPKGD